MRIVGGLVLIAMAAGPVCAYAQQAPVSDNEARRDAGAVISPDIKGYGRDNVWRDVWRDGAWRPRGGSPAATAAAVAAPELSLGFAASSLALCIGGVAVARGRRTI